MLAQPKSESPKIVPNIREELRLIPAANNHDGSPAWMMQDPICNKFYRIGWLDFEILSRWQMRDIDNIIEAVNNNTTLNIDENHVLELMLFLRQHYLLVTTSAENVSTLIEKANASKKSALNWLLHHYLFFRIPIIRPQKLLAKLFPFLKWIFTPTMALVVLLVTFTGLFLAAREWDTFQNTFLDQFTFSGLFSYGVALIFSKCLHELGHAITATRYGVRVAQMGVALMVLFPMPYTDTSESWKLTNPKQRLHIASAGIITELALAGFATLAWALAPDGNIKEALFFLATTSWVLTLIINLSPFLRFDGYFILSDLLDFPNLHERAGVFAKTTIRRYLLGFKDEWPENISQKKRYTLVIFALLTWTYRLIVFLGIGLLVYYFFFKVLGIMLFILEILWFILLPIWNEVKIWIKRRSEIKSNRFVFGALLLVIFIILGMLPWQTTVRGATWIHAKQQLAVFTPAAGKLVSFHPKGSVQKGDTLFELTSPDIAIKAARSLALSDAKKNELRSLTGIEDGESKRAQLLSQQEQFNAEVKLYEDELSRLYLTAPFAGELHDVDENLTTGTWINHEQKLAVLIDPNSWIADVFLDEEDINRITIGDKVTLYILKSYLQQFSGIVTTIDNAARVESLPHPMLDARYGGPITTLENDDHIPKHALVKIQVRLDEKPQIASMVTGNAEIETQARAWLPTVFERIAAIFIRESGF